MRSNTQQPSEPAQPKTSIYEGITARIVAELEAE
jgi:hypothetical protein